MASGECGVALANTYYYARLLASDKPEDRKLTESVALVWPNQKSFSTHLNVSGAGVLKNAPHKKAALRALEYRASDASKLFHQWQQGMALRGSAPLNNRTLEAIGTFKADSINVSALGKNQPTAQKVFDRAESK